MAVSTVESEYTALSKASLLILQIVNSLWAAKQDQAKVAVAWEGNQGDVITARVIIVSIKSKSWKVQFFCFCLTLRLWINSVDLKLCVLGFRVVIIF